MQPTVAPPLVDASLEMKNDQYHDEKVPKDLIVLHHTVSGSWAGSVKFWASDAARVGTAYGIDRDGTVYRAFPDDRWAIHLFRFRKGAPPTPSFSSAEGLAIEKRSIGIEIVSFGALTESNGWLYNAYGVRMGRVATLIFEKKVQKFTTPWRGVQYFETYTEASVMGVCKLVNYLCLTKSIPASLPVEIRDGSGDPRKWLTFKGIVSHAMLRPDKTDTHPGFPYDRLLYSLTGKITW